LRVQVLLWTVLPLTILLIAFSLTGVGTHQASMRALAADEAQRLAAAVATGIAQQISSYRVGLDGAARLLAHHTHDAAMRDFHLAETSAVLGGVELLLLDGDGAPVAWTGESEPVWAGAAATFEGGASGAQRSGNRLLIRAPLAGHAGALVASVPITVLTFGAYVEGESTQSTVLSLLDGDGAPMRTAGAVEGTHDNESHMAASTGDNNALVQARAQVPGTDWTVLLAEYWHTRTAPLIRFEQAMPFVLLVAAAVSFLTLFSGLRLVVQPLRALATSAQRIGAGDFDAASAPVGGVNEIENVRVAMDQMAQQVREHQRVLEQHLLAVTQAQEDERARLARELHDDTVQGLIALDHRLQKAQRTLTHEPAALKQEVAALRQMTHVAIDEVRRFSRALRPAYLDDLGLGPALELLCQDTGATCTLSGSGRRLDPAVELALYRMAQESISNARRHAQARHITLALDFSPHDVTLCVTDDGVGFMPPAHPASLSRDGHFGLLGIHERAELIGAQAEIRSSPGQGTTVAMRLAA
jgi:two-component system sensor histidine kinase UhpB